MRRFPKERVLVVTLTLESGKNLLKWHETKETPRVLALLSFFIFHSSGLGENQTKIIWHSSAGSGLDISRFWASDKGLKQELPGIWKRIKVSLVTAMKIRNTLCVWKEEWAHECLWRSERVWFSQRYSYRQLVASLCGWVLGTDLLHSTRGMQLLNCWAISLNQWASISMGIKERTV